MPHFITSMLWVIYIVITLGASAFAVTPIDPELVVQEKALDGGGRTEDVDRLWIFPRHEVPQVRRIEEPGALWMAISIRRIALLPGDRIIVKDAQNDSIIAITASNQSNVREVLRRPRPILWNHPFLTSGSRVTIEYWPSLMTLVLPINRKQLDNPVLIVDSYAFATRRSRRSRASDDDNSDEDGGLESTVGGTNEMKSAICYKTTKPEMYSKARVVARLIIPEPSQQSPSGVRTEFDSFGDGEPSAGDPEPPSNSPSRATSWTFCTGWLLGRGNHMLTNYHCFYQLGLVTRRGVDPNTQAFLRIESPTSTPCTTSMMANAEINFMAESKACTDVGKTGERAGEIDATRVTIVAMSQSLDYALLQVHPLNSSRNGTDDLARKFGYLTLRESGPVDEEPIYIPQHPNGQPKMIAAVKDGKPSIIRLPNRVTTDDNSIAPFGNVSVWYNADTAPGSSGSPVISRTDNTVVALHHAGTRVRTSVPTNSNALDLTELNVGIRSDAIVRDLRQRGVLPLCAVAEKCDGKGKRISTCCAATW